MNGFINVMKPPGMTSSDVVLYLRRRLPKGTAVGHGGTLDPDAAGVLPVCIGSATRLFDYIVDKEKTYVAEMRLGICTDTQDATGAITARLPVQAGAAEIRAALPAFTGEILQVPPAYSAIKRNGQKLCDVARRGGSVTVEARKVKIFDLAYLGQSAPDRHMLRITCGKGTYIRTLIHDIGRQVGCGAHMTCLIRTASGIFDLAGAHPLEALDGVDLTALLLPMDAPLTKYPRVDVDATKLRFLQNGNPVRAGWYGEDIRPAEEIVRIYANGDFFGMGQAQSTGDIAFRAMLRTGKGD